MALAQLSPKEISPNPKTDPNSKPSPNLIGGEFSSGEIVWIPLQVYLLKNFY